MGRYITEFIGTFFLVLTIGLVVATQQPLAALAIGAVLMVMVYMGGHISGAHFNPAVTLGAYLVRQLPRSYVVPYMLMQCAGAIVGAVVAFALTGAPFAPGPAPGMHLLAAAAVEFLFTLALVLVVLNVTGPGEIKGNSYFGLAIGFTLAVGVIAGGPLSGGAFNPAVALGPNLTALAVGAGISTQIWIYLVGPFLGSIAAAGLYGAIQKGNKVTGVGADLATAPVPPTSTGPEPPELADPLRAR